jgi:hypothetical protein
MATKSAPYYWLECDQCGIKSIDDSDFGAWYDESAAIDEAREFEWLVVEGGTHLCEDCAAGRVCPDCGAEKPVDAELCAGCDRYKREHSDAPSATAAGGAS